MTPPLDLFGEVTFADEEELIFADDVLDVATADGDEFAGTGMARVANQTKISTGTPNSAVAVKKWP